MKKVTTKWEFPLSFDELAGSPLAGSFDARTSRLLDHALGCFPFATRTGDGRRAWRISAPGRGTVEAWVTSDGSLFLDGNTTLHLVYGILVHLSAVCDHLALEDRITGMLHNRTSLLRLVRRDEERSRGYSFDPNHTPPMAA